MGFISWINEGVVQEAIFEEGKLAFTAGASLEFEYSDDQDGWQLRLKLNSNKPIELRELYITQSHPFQPEDRIFLNGYQSWTESREFEIDEHIPRLSGPIQGMIQTTGDYTFYNASGKNGRLHSWSFATLRRNDSFATLWRDAKPETGYTIFEFQTDLGHVLIRKDVGGLTLNGELDLMDVRIRAFKGTELDHNDFEGCKALPVKRPVSGWTSWYNYYTDIDEQIIMDNLRAFAHRSIPIDFFQIDDGWQPAVGDWMEANKKFPSGMKMIADQAHRYGIKAGLWLAPLIADQKSSIYQNHRDWLVTYDGEHLVEAGVNPGWAGLLKGTYYALNLDLPEVRAHLKEVFDQVLNVWGFDLVKLDFLFAAALIPKGGKSRGQRMHEAFAFLRECCGEKLILGCGIPLSAAWEQADYCRIGPDISLNWDMRSAKMMNLRERASTHNAIVNTISRRHFSGRYFANDPDVFILRKKNTSLSPLQKHSLYVINNIFGDLIFTSDNIGGYDNGIMQQYLSSFPILPKKITKVESEAALHQIWFEIGDRKYFAATNLSRDDKKIVLPFSKSFQNGVGFIQNANNQYLKPFETRVFLAFPEDNFGIAGSSLHLFPGSEIDVLEFSENEVELKLHTQSKTTGEIFLKTDPKYSNYLVNGRKYENEQINGDTILKLSVKEGQII